VRQPDAATAANEPDANISGIACRIPFAHGRHRSRTRKVADEYIGTGRILKELGHGAEGFVFSTESVTAIKVFRHREKYASELAVYQRLREHDVLEVLGFAVPRLIKWEDRLLVIEMTLVQPPFLLDFSQAALDEPRDFPEDVINEWWSKLAEEFGERLPVVQDVFNALQAFGIYYYDLAPRNINFENHPLA
jgi:hypothetical protein